MAELLEWLTLTFLASGTLMFTVFTAWGIWSLWPLRQRAREKAVFDGDMPIMIVERPASNKPHMH